MLRDVRCGVFTNITEYKIISISNLDMISEIKNFHLTLLVNMREHSLNSCPEPLILIVFKK